MQEDLGPKYPSVTNWKPGSDWEIEFYKTLRTAGIKAVPQYPVEKYRLDFLVVDGERCHRNWTGGRGQFRNHRLYEPGYDVLRFWVYELRDDIDGYITRVQGWLGSGSIDWPAPI